MKRAIQKLPRREGIRGWRFGFGTQWWLINQRRRKRQQENGIWFRFRAFDMIQGDGISVSSVPDQSGGPVALNAPSGGTPPMMIEGALPNGQKAVFFDPAFPVTRLDFNQNFTGTSSTIIVVAKATNVLAGDQGLVVCANTAVYGLLTDPFNNHWGCYVKGTVESGFSLVNVFKVITLRVNANASFDLFDMATKVSFGAQAGSFPGRGGSSLGGDPGGTQKFQGYVAELLIYDRPIADDQILAKVAELKSFYGI
jgi:hypothetical protein